MAIRRVSQKLVSVTHTLAKRFADLPCIDGDRSATARRIAAIKEYVLDGVFYAYPWATCKCLEDGITRRLNGNNGSIAFSDPSLPTEGCEVLLIEWEADTRLEMTRIHRHFDCKGSIRTNPEIVGTIARLDPTLTDKKTFPNNFLAACVNGFSVVKYGDFHYTKENVNDRSELLMESSPGFFHFVKKILNTAGGSNRLLTKVPVMAAIYLGYLEAPELAERFWTAVATPGRSKSQELAFREWLLKKKIGRGQGNLSPEDYYNYCKDQWTTWIAKKSGITKQASKQTGKQAVKAGKAGKAGKVSKPFTSL